MSATYVEAYLLTRNRAQIIMAVELTGNEWIKEK